jgi:hypothetical protein
VTGGAKDVDDGEKEELEDKLPTLLLETDREGSKPAAYVRGVLCILSERVSEAGPPLLREKGCRSM